MKYTRKDFERIAAEIRHHKPSEREGCIQVWIARFKESNSLFDETKFRQACGESVPTTKKFDAAKELDKVESALSGLGARMSEPFIARAKELIVELSKFKGVKINHFIMGMGGWSLDGTIPFKEIWSGGVEEGNHEIELPDFDNKRSGWLLECYENVNPGITKVGYELNEICDILTDNPYLQIFDIPEKEMKKLLKRR